jgi:hypothetical protein
MTAQILPFPPRGPFAVRVEREFEREHPAYLVICRDHGWPSATRATRWPKAARSRAILTLTWKFGSSTCRHARPSASGGTNANCKQVKYD